jgi:Sulfotransferase domain
LPLVDFFIIGVQKGGTTALDAYLRRSAQVLMADLKELHFFDNDEIDWKNPDYRLLHRHFAIFRHGKTILGEATPIYIYWPYAMERLNRYNPAARLLVCLRHPAFRAHSHWRMVVQRRDETLSFEDAISEAGRRRTAEAPGGVHRAFSYIERGFYAPQIRRVKALFPPQQLLFLRTDDLWRDTGETLSQVCRFLGVGRPESWQRRYIVPCRSDTVGVMTPAVRRRLNEIFAADITETALLTGLSLSKWLEPDYHEPMAAD